MPRRDNQPWTIRPASVEDANNIARIYNLHVELGGATFDTEYWTTMHVEGLVQCKPPQAWIVGILDGKVVGWSAARWYSMRFGYRFTQESAIYLDPSAIGSGLADGLQTQLESHCLNANVHHLVAKIATENHRSIAFHYRHGYELVGVQKEVGHMEGAWKDVSILQKVLKASTPTDA